MPMNSMHCRYWLLGLSGSFVMGLSCGLTPSATAQIRADTTLPTPSAVTSTPNRALIQGGTQRGTNLFHSFRQFSVPRNSTAVFRVDRAVTNVFSRVTGSSVSKIDGKLQVLQSDDNSLSSANFFLLNPNGILFGSHASLNVGGSFLATTADRIDFADGAQFSATAPQTNPLLTVHVPIGLQFGDRPGDIENRSRTSPLDDPNNPGQTNPLDSVLSPQGLNVTAGQTLALIGGDIFMPRGRITVEAGRIELGSLAPQGRVEIVSLDQGWALRYDCSQPFGDIRLRSAVLETSGVGGGAIQLQGRQIRLNGNTQIISTTTGDQLGRSLSVNASDTILINNLSILSTETLGTGTAGNVNLSTRQLITRNNGSIGSFVSGAGQGGTVRIVASDSITVGGDTSGTQLSRLTTQTDHQSTGAAGNIEIQTDRLQVLQRGQITSTTLGSGDAGDIQIRAAEVNLAGTAPSAADDQPVEVSSGVFAGTTSRGNSGTIRIQSQRLSLSHGALVQASTYGSGNAGNVEIRASEWVDVAGASASGQRSAILASSGGLRDVSFKLNRSASGRGGNVTITTQTLRVRNGGVVAVNSLSPNAPGAGMLQVQAQFASLDNHAQLNAETESAGANISLPQVGVLLLRRQSSISTDAGTRSSGGMGGNIQINGNFVIAAASENSDITANAIREDAGNVALTANVVGISPQPSRTTQSDITATSERGISGEITISQPQTDPTQSLVALPITIFDAAGLIAQRCSDRSGTVAHSSDRSSNRFVITGRGGLPLSPADVRSNYTVLAPWATLASGERKMQQSSQTVEQTTPIGEAQGWLINPEGKVELVTQMPVFVGFPADECAQS